MHRGKVRIPTLQFQWQPLLFIIDQRELIKEETRIFYLSNFDVKWPKVR